MFCELCAALFAIPWSYKLVPPFGSDLVRRFRTFALPRLMSRLMSAKYEHAGAYHFVKTTKIFHRANGWGEYQYDVWASQVPSSMSEQHSYILTSTSIPKAGLWLPLDAGPEFFVGGHPSKGKVCTNREERLESAPEVGNLGYRCWEIDRSELIGHELKEVRCKGFLDVFEACPGICKDWLSSWKITIRKTFSMQNTDRWLPGLIIRPLRTRQKTHRGLKNSDGSQDSDHI